MKEKRLVTMIPGNGNPMVAKKKERNSLCECGSGKKQKKCCGTETKYYLTKK